MGHRTGHERRHVEDQAHPQRCEKHSKESHQVTKPPNLEVVVLGCVVEVSNPEIFAVSIKITLLLEMT